MLRLASAEALRIRQHAENGYPHEVVGILAGDAASATVTRVAHLVNERSTEARTRYRQGLSDFLPVLTALQSQQQAQLQLLSARRQALSYRVQLCRALGGTWTNTPAKPAPQAD